MYNRLELYNYSIISRFKYAGRIHVGCNQSTNDNVAIVTSATSITNLTILSLFNTPKKNQ